MTSSADLPEGFLAEVFRNGCQCDHCVKWRAEVARLWEAIRAYDAACSEYESLDDSPEACQREPELAHALDVTTNALRAIAREAE